MDGKEGGKGTRRGNQRRAHQQIVVRAAIAVMLPASAGLISGCRGSSHPQRDADASALVRAAQARAVARQAGLDPGVQDFLARAAAASAVTSTVVYDQGGGQSTVVMSRPPNRRIEIRDAAGPGSLDRLVVRGTATYLCDFAGAKWSCAGGVVAAPGGPFTPDAVTRTIASLAGLTHAYHFAVGPRPMVGLTAECLTADRDAGQPSDNTIGRHAAICIAPSGVILRVEGEGNPLQATSYRESVPSGAFDLPAPATPAAPPTT